MPRHCDNSCIVPRFDQDKLATVGKHALAGRRQVVWRRPTDQFLHGYRASTFWCLKKEPAFASSIDLNKSRIARFAIDKQ